MTAEQRIRTLVDSGRDAQLRIASWNDGVDVWRMIEVCLDGYVAHDSIPEVVISLIDEDWVETVANRLIDRVEEVVEEATG